MLNGTDTRRFITRHQLRAIDIGDTWNLDNDPYVTVDFDGFCWDGCCRWRHSSGRVFIYTEEQCCRVIYR